MREEGERREKEKKEKRKKISQINFIFPFPKKQQQIT